ncbi:MAG: FAD-dependent oxidoreductase [Candidatus Methanomethylophilaceae archaeon]|nr:FAD-dependent oxidoreductase [Candidatus Methanomethylophilaceae archaeon]
MDADVFVIGSGPSGVQAAIHAARKRASVVVAGKPSSSSMSGTEIENYFGSPPRPGDEILAEGIALAKSFGAAFLGQNVVSASAEDGRFRFSMEDGTEVVAKAAVIATGISRKSLGIPGEKDLFGKGVSYCAVCDCNFYRGRKAVVVGNDSEAAVSAELMTRYASETHWVAWDAEAEETLARKAAEAGAVMHASKPKAIEGDGKVERIVLEDGTIIPTDGVFIELGARSSADIAMDLGVMPEMDDSVKVGSDCSTEVPGVFACGDVTGRPWQVAKAVGQGCVAGMSAADYARKAE